MKVIKKETTKKVNGAIVEGGCVMNPWERN